MKNLVYIFLSFISIYGNSQWSQLGQDINGQNSGDYTGTSVSINQLGTIIAESSTNNTGQVRVFEWDGIQWNQIGNDLNGESIYSSFGYDISLDDIGHTLAIGSPGSGINGSSSGLVKVFNWNGSNWVLKGSPINGINLLDGFGSGIELSADGNSIVIGSPGSDINGSASGAVRVYDWDGTSWVQRGLDILGLDTYDQCGEKVAISSNGVIIALGSINDNNINGFMAGKSRIFKWNGSVWVQIGQSIYGEAANDHSGQRLKLNSSGNTIIIGAIGNDANGNSSGHARVYEWNGIMWLQKGIDIDGFAELDLFSESVDIDSTGNRILVGGSRNDDNGIYSGHVKVYEWINNAWLQIGHTIVGSNADDFLGYAAACNWDASRIVIGSPRCSVTSLQNGKVEVFKSCYILPDTINVGIINNDPFLIAQNSNCTYQWLNCNEELFTLENDTSQTFLPIINGEYSVEITQEGCVDTSRCVLIETVNVSPQYIKEVSIYPNPSNGEINLDLGNLQNVSIEVVSVRGEIVYQENGINNSIHIFSFNATNGVYILKLISENKFYYHKFILE